MERMSQKRPVSPFRVAFWRLLGGAVLVIAPFHRVVVSGNSMYPTLKNRENYVADRLYWRLTGLQREDIVVFREGKDDVVKRLVGMPADILQLEFAPGTRYIQFVRNLTVDPKARKPPADN